jgi:hypothetical protein
MSHTVALSTVAVLLAGGVGAAAAQPVSAAPQPHPVAVARQLLESAPTIAGAERSSTAPTRTLRQPPEWPVYEHLVQRHRFWTVDRPWRQVYAALTSTTPAGLVADGTGATGGPKTRDVERFAAYRLRRLPADLAYAELLVAVAPGHHGKAVIGVYAQVVMQPKRPAAEDVPASLDRATVGVRTGKGHLVNVHTVTGARAHRLVGDFDALRVTPPGAWSCPAFTGRQQVVTFHFAGHTVVAASGPCGLFDVTRDGHHLPALVPDRAFTSDVHRDL